MEQSEFGGGVPLPSRRRTRRTEDFGIVFTDGLCEGWTFEVSECFRSSLDIILSTYVDDKRPQKTGQKVFRTVWTRGNPPLRSFAVGDVFYDPPGIRRMVWSEALQVLCRSIRVVDSKADADDGSAGWVSINLAEYANGKVLSTAELTISQNELETLLRTGLHPAAPVVAQTIR